MMKHLTSTMCCSVVEVFFLSPHVVYTTVVVDTANKSYTLSNFAFNVHVGGSSKSDKGPK